MAMNNHMEARRRQMFMERVCAARRRLESQQTQDNQEGASSAFTSQSEPLLSSDGGPSKTARAPTDKEQQVVKSYYNYTPSHTKKLLTAQMPPIPKPCPPSLQGVKRDHIYKILHPYSEY